MEHFPLRLERRQGCLLSPVLFTIAPEILAVVIEQENKERLKNNIKQVKVFSLQDIITLYVKNPKASTKLL